ncbi:MAG: hypothetical protein KJO77_07670 [Bacteroidia bacterium]|nr:hypothetical protein [Bacteroidia bacterium]NND51058.1 hypothetical protein [Flavobacteriaceae bacterium]
MKKQNNFILSLFAVLLIASCTSRDNVIDDVLDGVENGAVLRTTQVFNADIPLGDETAVWSIEIEYQDVLDGAGLLSEVRVYAGFKDNNDDGVDVNAAEVIFQTIPAADFSPGPFDLPRAIITLSAAEMLNAFGLTFDDTNSGDQYQIRLEVELTDGRIFTNTDAAGIITGGFFASPYFYNANVICEFERSIATDYNYVQYDMGAGDGSGGQQATGFGPINGTITWGDGGDISLVTTPDYSIGMFGFVWGDSPATNGMATIKWFCATLTPQGQDQYSDSYTYNITNVSGDTMTFDWINTWGDIGTVELTRADGLNWPGVFGSD